MRRKLLAALLGVTMTATLLAGCSKEAGNTETTTAETTTAAPVETTTQAPTEAPTAAVAEALPETPFAHITFDGADEGYTAVVQSDDVGSLTGATYGIVPTDVTFQYTNGPVDQCLYIDGTFGLDLNLAPTNTDTYTVSFWTNAARLSDYGPTLQMGYNMGMAADVGNNVTWFNVTQSAWGADSAKIFPIVWSRNEASDAADGTDCWPWMYAFDDSIHGKKEWVMVTIVCSGEQQTGPLGSTTTGAQYYVNGVMVYDSQANYTSNAYFEYTWDASLAPNIMKPGDSEFESLFGINYWDTIFKGYVDDLYIYDTALTAGQVSTLYAMGNASVETVQPEGVVAETEPVAVVVEPTGIAQVGATDCSTGWWSAFSDTLEVPVGQTARFKFVNWHTAEASNWNNFLVVLQNMADVHSADPAATVANDPAYAEYAVLRADNWGWGAGYDGIVTPENTYDWDAFLPELQGATVVVDVTNNGETADVVATVTSQAGIVYTQTYKGIAITGDLHCCLTAELACLDIISMGVGPAFTGEVVQTGSYLVGLADCSTPWWSNHADPIAVPAGETVTVEFTNWHTATNAAAWNNFLVVLQNTATGHSADENPEYAEYAVLRADNWGWGAGYDGIVTPECNYNWATFVSDMQGANVVLDVTNNGETADVVATITTITGDVFTQKYAGIAITGDLYFSLFSELGCLDVK